MKKRAVILITLLLILVNMVLAVEEVGPGKTHATIQAGINAASVGEEVHVYPAGAGETYKEDVLINKRVRLIGIGDKSEIVVNGADTIMNISADNVYVENFTLSNTDHAVRDSFGLWMGNGQNHTIIKNIDIYNISASNGNAYAVFLRNSNNNTIGVNKIDDIYAPGTADIACGICMKKSHNNTFVNLQNITNISARVNARGINITQSNNNTFSGDNLKISKLSAVYTSMHVYGIHVKNSKNSVFKGISELFQIGYKQFGNYLPNTATGIFIDDSDNITITGNGSAKINHINASGTQVGDTGARAVFFDASNNSNMSGFTQIHNVDDIGASGGVGEALYIDSSENNSFHDLKIIKHIYGGNTKGNGIRLDNSHNNSLYFDNIIIRNITVSSASDHVNGIWLSESSNNTLKGIGFIHRLGDVDGGAHTMANHASGIFLYLSDNNTIIGNGTADITYINTTGTQSLTPYAGGSHGIYLKNSDDNNFTGFRDITDFDNIGGSSNDRAVGIYLDTSNNNTIETIRNIKNFHGGASWTAGIHLLSSNDNVIYGQDINIDRIESGGNDAAAYAMGIFFSSSDRNNITDLGALTNVRVAPNAPGGRDSGSAFPLYLYIAHNNTIQGNGTVQVSHSHATNALHGNAIGVFLFGSHYNNITGLGNITNITARKWGLGILLGPFDASGQRYSSHNIIKDPTISNISATTYTPHQFMVRYAGKLNTIYATFTPLITSPKYTSTQTRFLQYERMSIDGISAAIDDVTDPVGMVNITKYVDIVDYLATSWIWVNYTYKDIDLFRANVSEENLSVWKHPAAWTRDIPALTDRGVNTELNYVWANITNFGSEFGPLSNGTYEGDKTANLSVYYSDFTGDCSDDLIFHGNYTNYTGTVIPSAQCNITFDDDIGSVHDMTENGTYGYYYIRTADWAGAGIYYYTVNCSATNYDFNSTTASITFGTCGGGAGGGAIPEFNLIGIFLILIIAIASYIIVSKRK